MDFSGNYVNDRFLNPLTKDCKKIVEIVTFLTTFLANCSNLNCTFLSSKRHKSLLWDCTKWYCSTLKISPDNTSLEKKHDIGSKPTGDNWVNLKRRRWLFIFIQSSPYDCGLVRSHDVDFCCHCMTQPSSSRGLWHPSVCRGINCQRALLPLSSPPTNFCKQCGAQIRAGDNGRSVMKCREWCHSVSSICPVARTTVANLRRTDVSAGGGNL